MIQLFPPPYQVQSPQASRSSEVQLRGGDLLSPPEWGALPLPNRDLNGVLDVLRATIVT